MSNKLNVLVCGTNFGKFYADSCIKSENLNLTGILSKGSERSLKEAKKRNVNLYTDAENVKDADMAVVAARTLITGGKSSDTIKKLLQMEVPVLQEQPVHVREIQGIIKQLQGKNCGYFVNNFYRFLPSVERFLKITEKIKKEHDVLRIRTSCSSQVLYPLVDILYEMLGGIKDFSIEKVHDDNMSVLAGNADGIKIIINYYNEYSEDVDGSLALFFDIKLDTDAGNLILNDPEGSVVWQSHLTYDRESDFDDEKFKAVRPLETLFDCNVLSYAQRYTLLWPKAMEKSILNFYERISGEAGIKELEKRMLKQCEICSQITNAAGRPKKTEVNYVNSVSLL